MNPLERQFIDEILKYKHFISFQRMIELIKQQLIRGDKKHD